MAQLQAFVSNVPLQVAKNLRFNDDNGIPVTQLLPVGMNGVVVNDSPRTGYISRIGAVLSDQIDLYNQVTTTLNTYGQNITTLQQQVAALELSGTTVPLVNGHCFTGDALSPITTVVELMATSACDYKTVLGTTSNLMLAILAEGASTLNALAAFSQGSAMAGLSGWKSTPTTIADTINNLWLSYLDSRAGVSSALAEVTPSCSQAIIDFMAHYMTAAGNGSGIFVYFSGYSFIPTAYTDNGSTVTITDGVGGVYTTAIDLVSRSHPNADPLFVGISGTPLSVNQSTYLVTLNSKIKSTTNTCTKLVMHNTDVTTPAYPADTSCCPVKGTWTLALTSGTTSAASYPLISGLPFTPTWVGITSKTAANFGINTAGGLDFDQIFITYVAGGARINFAGGGAHVDFSATMIYDWIAFR